MKQMFIFSLLLAIVFLATPAEAEGKPRPKIKKLDGKDVIVRVYSNWQEDPAAFEKVTLQVNGRAVRFNFDDVDDSAFVAVFGEDQEDEIIRQLIGSRIYGWAYKKGLVFPLPEKAASQQTDYWWAFEDALGNSISQAAVKIYLKHEGRQIFIGEGQLDEQGRLRTPFCLGNARVFVQVGRTKVGPGGSRLCFVVSLPDYGTIVVEVLYWDERERKPDTLFIPIVRPGTEADKRAIWGTVVDPEGNPVGGAAVDCTALYPPGGDLVPAGIGSQIAKVLTDKDGSFRLYQPISEDIEQIGTLIPPKTEYFVIVDAPKHLGLVQYMGKILNGQETTITLKRAGGFRTFIFEDEKGPITDPNLLRVICLTIKRPDKRELHLKYNDWRDGGMFPLGTYTASMRRIKKYKFEPIVVNAESPKELVFKVKDEVVYYGKVVHGITDEPMEGVFVIDMRAHHSRTNLSSITPKQWEELRALPANPSGPNESLEPVKSVYSFEQIVRTDAEGWFEMRLPPRTNIFGFVVFAENYLPVRTCVHFLKPDEDRLAEVPLTKLFPAAKVVVEPYVENWKEYRYSRARWFIDKNNNPDWVSALVNDNSGKQEGVRKEYHLRPNKVQSIYVPAGVSLQVQLYIPYETRWSPITIAQAINLQPGETLDLGRHTFQRTITVFVEVLDSAGEPVEGVPVSVLPYAGRKIIHNTDEEGIALFHVPSYAHKGQFVVELHADELNLREAIPYEINDEEDEYRVFTLTVPDEILYHLFK